MSLFLFFYDNFPSLSLIAWLFPLAFIISYFSLILAGLLKMSACWRTGLTRKTFHFLVFIFVFYIQRYWGLPGTFVVGWAVTLILAYAIRQGDGCLLYEAIAREQDAPHRSRYIVYSYLATFGGGVLSNLFFGPEYALVGYLITGIGDAVAEPVGVLYGKHRYRVINFNRPVSYRSYEGSAAVFLISLLVLGLYSCFNLQEPGIRFHLLVAGAAVCTLLEAISPQGWDNLVMQVGSSYFVYLWLG